MRPFGAFDMDSVAGLHNATAQSHAHDPGLSNNLIAGFLNQFGQQSRSEFIHLRAGIAQARHTQHRIGPDPQQRITAKMQKIDSTRRNVFTQIAGVYLETFAIEFFEQFGVDQMHLPQVWLGRVLLNPAAMSHGVSAMGIAAHTETCEDFDAAHRLLAEAVLVVAADGNDQAVAGRVCHGFIPLPMTFASRKIDSPIS
jgi:hypothetical protein